MIFYYSLSEINEACKFIFKNSNSKIILFEGDLGTGKTTLIKNLCYELGSVDNVSSPTFPILNIYDNKKNKIYHADLYRVKNINDLNEIGFFDIINTNDWLFVEWPKKIIDLIDKPFSIVNITIEDDNKRKIELKNK
tara:strand:+ start:261 stop:671 length:411 start_codon:yes stop_codon:yes gene_type:complete